MLDIIKAFDDDIFYDQEELRYYIIIYINQVNVKSINNYYLI